MIYFTLFLCAFVLGRYQTQIWDWAVETLTSNLPDSKPNTLGLGADVAQYPEWASAGEYLVRDAGVWRNVTLTRHARYLMGQEVGGLIQLTKASEITGYEAQTPTGGSYTRRRTRLVWRAEVCLA